MRTTPRTLFGQPLGIALIIAEKIIRSCGLLALAALLLGLRAKGITDPFQRLFSNELAEDPHDLLATFVIGLVPSLSLRLELLLAIVAVLYAILEGVEVWGLWRGVIWVEVFIIVELTALLPFDLFEIVRHFSYFKIVSTVINAAIVWYLVRMFLRKRALHKPHRRLES
jgi:uncharacterized membrane protein